MIEFSLTEVIAIVWAVVATAFWHDAHSHRKHIVSMTAQLLRGVAQGKVHVTETDQGFEFKEIKQ